MIIERYDNERYIINSDTDRAHIVDMMAEDCSCEAFTIRKIRPCKHLLACITLEKNMAKWIALEKNIMNYTIFDIETEGLPESELNIPTFEASKVLKDPEKIKLDLEKKKTEWLETCALRADCARVLCIGFLSVGETGRTGSFLQGEEKGMLEMFWAAYSSTHHPFAPFVGHFARGFDVPFLIRRSWLTGVTVPIGVMEGRFLNRRFICTMEAWGCGTRDSISLANLAAAFGLPGKSGNGRDFAELYAKDREAALQYLSNDLSLTEQVAKRMGLIC